MGDDRFCFQFPSVQKVRLILSDLIWAELIGRLVEVTRKALDSADVRAYSGGREVMSLEFLQHDFA